MFVNTLVLFILCTKHSTTNAVSSLGPNKYCLLNSYYLDSWNYLFKRKVKLNSASQTSTDPNHPPPPPKRDFKIIQATRKSFQKKSRYKLRCSTALVTSGLLSVRNQRRLNNESWTSPNDVTIASVRSARLTFAGPLLRNLLYGLLSLLMSVLFEVMGILFFWFVF